MNVIPFQKWRDRNPELDSIIDCPLCEGEGYDEEDIACPLCNGDGELDTAYEIYLSDIERDVINLRRWSAQAEGSMRCIKHLWLQDGSDGFVCVYCEAWTPAGEDGEVETGE